MLEYLFQEQMNQDKLRVTITVTDTVKVRRGTVTFTEYEFSTIGMSEFFTHRRLENQQTAASKAPS